MSCGTRTSRLGVAALAAVLGFGVLASGQTMSDFSPTSGTAGTQITITGSGFGSLGGKVYLSSPVAGAPGLNAVTSATPKPIALKVAIWTPTMIVAVVSKAPMLADFSVRVMPKSGGLATLAKDFSLAPASLDSASPASAAPGSIVTLSGRLFGLKRGKVYLQDGMTRRSCKVLSWTMNPATNDSTATLLVPVAPAGVYDVVLNNKLSETYAGSALTVAP